MTRHGPYRFSLLCRPCTETPLPLSLRQRSPVMFTKTRDRGRRQSESLGTSFVLGCSNLVLPILAQDTYTDKVRVETLVQGIVSMQESINKDGVLPLLVLYKPQLGMCRHLIPYTLPELHDPYSATY